MGNLTRPRSVEPFVRRRAGPLAPFLLIVAVVTGDASTPVAATAVRCVGPAVVVEPAEVPAGGTVTVRGTGFGDDCHDTGPPPAGEGLLGKPLQDIEVYVEQGGRGDLVAAG